MNKCKNCYKLTQNVKFCSCCCAAKYSNKRREFNPGQDKRTKFVKCITCDAELEVNIRANSNKSKCLQCKLASQTPKRVKKIRKKICKYCGQENCSREDICKRYKLFPSLIKYFGFDKTKIGTPYIYEEFEKVRCLLRDEYLENELSLPDIASKYGLTCRETVRNLLRAFDIPRRSVSKGLYLSIKSGKKVPPSNPKYKQGWHKTWNNKKVFYRSSYELDYCKILDEQKIDYTMEELRIEYWDSQRQKYRIAVPDFLVKRDNLIVEIKSSYTYEPQNMRDKVGAYRKAGYEFKLILEGEETAI